MRISALIVLISSFLSYKGFSQVEPSFCNLNTFKTLEVIYPNSDSPRRLRVFKVGEVVLAGMGVGTSSPGEVADVAREYSEVRGKQNYCTWYWNTLNPVSAVRFNWEHLSHPNSGKLKNRVKEYSKNVLPTFFKNKINMVKCAKDFGYVGMGCNSQKHRGPTVFAMLLAFSGCSAQSASEIANEIWGLNGVEPLNRLALVQLAYEYGKQNPNESKELRELFE